MRTLVEQVKAAGLPRHVAVIMDGNGRWAGARGLPRAAGHQAGAHSAEDLIRFCVRKLGLEHLTLYAFSSENWSRPDEEVNYLMDLLERFIDDKLREFTEAGIRLRTAGDLDELPPRVRDVVAHAIRETKKGDGLQLTVAINYGARQEIARAVQCVCEDVASGKITLGEATERAISDRLDLAGLPDPDLIIRTGGEMRLSNFLLWQSVYSELYFTDIPWPDFIPAEFVRAIAEFQRRDRRYGAVKEAPG